MSSVVEWDGRLMDAFALPDSVGKLFDHSNQCEPFARREVGSIWNVHDLACNTITDPQGAVLSSCQSIQGRAGRKQGPREVSLIHVAFNFRDWGHGGLVAFMSGLQHLRVWLFQHQSIWVRFVNFLITETSRANVMTKQIRKSSHKIENALFALLSNLSVVEIDET